jgi:hypothetical protein
MKKYCFLFSTLLFFGNLFAQTWTNYTTSNTSTTLSGNVVNGIVNDNQGKKWVGTDGGVSKFYEPLNTAEIPDNTVQLFPNPVTGLMILTIPDTYLKGYLTIHSLQGQRMCSMTINDRKVKLDMSGYNEGIYFIRLITPGRAITMKIVVCR